MPLNTVRRALVVGAGTMGPGIAQVYAIAGVHVDLCDPLASALDSAGTRIRSGLATLAGCGALPGQTADEVAGRIHLTTDLEAVAPRADIVTEAVTEDRGVKTAVFSALDRLLRPGVILASNTSGLDVFTLLNDTVPGRMAELVIHHYFLPPTLVPLVEVVSGPATSAETVGRSVELLEALGRVPVVLPKFCPNFIVNSYQAAIWAVTARLLAEGIGPEAIDRAVKHSLGVRLPVVGVAQSLDFTGLDLVARILRHSGVDASAFEALVAEGRTGAKAGRGLYDYGGRTLAEVEAARDRRYRANGENLRGIGAYDPI